MAPDFIAIILPSDNPVSKYIPGESGTHITMLKKNRQAGGQPEGSRRAIRRVQHRVRELDLKHKKMNYGASLNRKGVDGKTFRETAGIGNGQI
jgi:hypothetical protein